MQTDSIKSSSVSIVKKPQLKDTIKNNIASQEVNFPSEKEELLEKVAKLKLAAMDIQVHINSSKKNNDFKDAGNRDKDLRDSLIAGSIGVCSGFAVMLFGALGCKKESVAIKTILGGVGIMGLSFFGANELFNYRRKKLIPQAEQHWNNILRKKEQEINKLEREYYDLGGNKDEIAKKTEELFFKNF